MAFRATRVCRGLFSSSRLPLRINALSQKHNPPQIQRVRFRKAPWTFRRALGPAILTGFLSWSLLSMLSGPDDLDDAEDAWEEAQEMDEEEYLENTIFLPLPFTTIRLPQERYALNGPEALQFRKVLRDRAMKKHMMDQLARDIAGMISKTVKMPHGETLGSWKSCKHSFKVLCPAFAPPEFERSGIELGPGWIALATRPVDSLIVSRLNTILYPTAVADSLWTSLKVAVNREMRPIAEAVGLDIPPTPEEDLIYMMGLDRNEESLINNADNATHSGPQGLQNAKLPEGMGISRPPKRHATEDATDEDEFSLSDVVYPVLEHFKVPSIAFAMKLGKTWRAPRSFPPRGSIEVSGPMEMVTSKAAVITLFVRAWWDPATEKFHGGFTTVDIKQVVWKQGTT